MDNQQSQEFKPKTDYTGGTMDSSNTETPQSGEQSSGGGLEGIGDKLGAAAGGSTGGSGDNQSLLDKGKWSILWAQISAYADGVLIVQV